MRPYSGRSEKIENYIQPIQPMLAHLDNKPFDNADWLFEIKWDGYRAVAQIQRKNIKLYSRNGLSFTGLYPAVADELKKIKDDVILDGEIVVLNENNKPDFQKLQHYSENQSLPLVYYVFDCLSYKGKDITHLPLIERKAIAEKVIPKSDIIKYSGHVLETGITFFENAVKMDLEGIVAKRIDSPYVSGRRTQDWLKIKNHSTQEAIITGYTAPRGSRKYFGALVLGIIQNNKLTYIGHTGTGFTEKILKDVYTKLQPLIRDSSPFDKKIPVNGAVTWVEPALVCAIKFSEITNDGIFRHPVFQGIRIDKTAKEANHIDAVVPTKTKAKITKASATPKPEPVKSVTEKSKADEKNKVLTIEGNKIIVTHPNKIYFPDDEITKGDVVDYYNSIYKYISPYLKDRPQSLKRNPGGIKDKGFFHKDAGEAAPEWVESIKLYSDSANKDIDYILCNNKATLLYLNNLGCIEINPWNSKVKNLDNPDYMVMDIDPSDKNTFEEVIDTALVIKEVLDRADAPSFCKTSGATGLHIYVPVKAAYDYESIRAFAEVIAMLTNEQMPKNTTLERPLDKRKGRIYIDYLQNKRGQTLASVYSVRPQPGATVSTPLEWREVKKGLHPSQFTIKNILKRVEKKGDLFAGVLKGKIDLHKCLENLGA